MKNKIKLMGALLVLSTVAMGASIDHIQTYSPEYLGNQAQNGMINKTSVYFNPAGLTSLDNGTYFQVGGQIALGYERMQYNGNMYKAKLVQPIPNFAVYDVKDGHANYWTFGGLGGGGDLQYNHGVAGTAVVPDLVNKGVLGDLPVTLHDSGSYAEGKNIYAQTTVGHAWDIDKKLSVSVAGRLVYGYRRLEASLNMAGKADRDIIENKVLEKVGIPKTIFDRMPATDPHKQMINKVIDEKCAKLEKIHSDLKGSRTAWGYGFQIGANYKATEKLNLAMRYDSKIKMNFKAHGTKTDVAIPEVGINLGFGHFYPEYVDGAKSRRDMPAILALGASYKVTPDWIVAASGNYYFNKDTKMDDIKGELHGIKPKYKNGYEIALGTEYRLNPKWALLGSVNYAYTGAKKQSFDDVEFAVNSTTVGAGVKYNPTVNDEIILSACHFFYDQKTGHYDEKYAGRIDNPKYHKSITAVGLSYTHKF